MSVIEVDSSVAVQDLTLVYGTNVDHMSTNELFTAAIAVKSEIDGLTKSNEGIESVKIAQKIESLQGALEYIRNLLDAAE